jgi:hypothetical protein
MREQESCETGGKKNKKKEHNGCALVKIICIIVNNPA